MKKNNFMQLMKKYFYSIFLGGLLFTGCSSSVMNEKTIESINAHVKTTDDHLSSYKKCESNILGLSAEGTSVMSYYDRESLVKMDIIYYGEGGKTEEAIYLKDGHVLYAKGLTTNYKRMIKDDNIYTDYDDVTLDPMNQFYFADQKLAGFIQGDEAIHPKSEEFLQATDRWKDKFKDLSMEENIKKICPFKGKTIEIKR